MTSDKLPFAQCVGIIAGLPALLWAGIAWMVLT
jgi:hypothetical protein